MRDSKRKLWYMAVVVLMIIMISTAFLQPTRAQNDSGWTRSEFKEIHGNFTPVVDDDGSVYVGTKDGYIYSFDKNGEIRWKNHYELGGIEFVGGTMGEDGYLYFAAKQGVIKLDTEGVVQWQHNMPIRYSGYTEYVSSGNIEQPPTVTPNGTVYVNGRIT